MKTNRYILRAAGILGAAAAICILPASANAGSSAKEAPATETKAPGLTGVELWTINCNRCHSYRGPNEFTAAHWQNILMHMRVRANIPAAQAREIMTFLQQGAGK